MALFQVMERVSQSGMPSSMSRKGRSYKSLDGARRTLNKCVAGYIVEYPSTVVDRKGM